MRRSTASITAWYARSARKVTSAVLAPFAAQVQQRYPDFTWPGENSAEAAVWMLLRAQPPICWIRNTPTGTPC